MVNTLKCTWSPFCSPEMVLSSVHTSLFLERDPYWSTCGRRTRPQQARSLSPQGWGLIDLPLRASNEGSLRPRVARAQEISRLHSLPSFLHSFSRYWREWPRLPSTARIERAHSDCARSASKEGTWALPPPISRLCTSRWRYGNSLNGFPQNFNHASEFRK